MSEHKGMTPDAEPIVDEVAEFLNAPDADLPPLVRQALNDLDTSGWVPGHVAADPEEREEESLRPISVEPNPPLTLGALADLLSCESTREERALAAILDVPSATTPGMVLFSSDHDDDVADARDVVRRVIEALR